MVQRKSRRVKRKHSVRRSRRNVKRSVKRSRTKSNRVFRGKFATRRRSRRRVKRSVKKRLKNVRRASKSKIYRGGASTLGVQGRLSKRAKNKMNDEVRNKWSKHSLKKNGRPPALPFKVRYKLYHPIWEEMIQDPKNLELKVDIVRLRQLPKEGGEPHSMEIKIPIVNNAISKSKKKFSRKNVLKVLQRFNVNPADYRETDPMETEEDSYGSDLDEVTRRIKYLTIDIHKDEVMRKLTEAFEKLAISDSTDDDDQ